MPLNAWSDAILIAELSDEPAFSEDMDALIRSFCDNSGNPSGESGRDVILNMRSVSYLNSSNLAQLLRLRKLISARNCRLRICAVSDTVWTVFLTTGLDGLFTFNDDVSTALASLQIEARDQR